jgi:hypothetical protein
MTEFIRQDLSGARVEGVDFSRAWIRNVYFVGATLRGAWFEGVDIDGEIRNLRINGVDVGPLIEAELDRRHPERTKLRPTSADGFREAWTIIEQAWSSTVGRARALPPALLHERVDDEWSFIETLRHLLFATDAWLLRAFLGRSDPYTPLDLPHTEMAADPSIPNDSDARPSLDEVLALRAERTAIVRDALAGLTDAVLAGDTDPITGPGYPAAGTYAVSRCLRAVVNEEWRHRLFAERDLGVLEARANPANA